MSKQFQNVFSIYLNIKPILKPRALIWGDSLYNLEYILFVEACKYSSSIKKIVFELLRKTNFLYFLPLIFYPVLGPRAKL